MSLTVLQRTGSCNRCGDCCTDTGHDTERETGLVTTVPGYCVYFRWIVEGALSKCVGRDSTYYAHGCNVFPDAPKDNLHRCSYTFVSTEVTSGGN